MSEHSCLAVPGANAPEPMISLCFTHIGSFSRRIILVEVQLYFFVSFLSIVHCLPKSSGKTGFADQKPFREKVSGLPKAFNNEPYREFREVPEKIDGWRPQPIMALRAFRVLVFSVGVSVSEGVPGTGIHRLRRKNETENDSP